MKTLSNRFKFIPTIFVLLACSDAPEKPAPVSEVKEKPIDSLATPTAVRPKKLVVDGIGYKLHKIDTYEGVIKRYAALKKIDWRLIVAIILKESSFNEKAVSRVGAKGLMQIMPLTQTELSERLEIEYIYERPEENIKAGVHHLSEQFQYFTEFSDEENLMKVALASYNCGAGRLIDAIKLATEFREAPLEWENIKWALKRLHSKHFQLHLAVWPNGKPRHGYFNNPIETASYVDRIWRIYEELKPILAE